MHDDTPAFLRTMTWAELLWQVANDDALRLKLGVKLCPFTGKVEEYMVVDRLGGDLNIWPAKWRSLLDAERAVSAI
ncbi:hypothetical protein [Devosia sp. 2618]|uniref:hypothetical protein n=1 Tax=Devosia sp. 2618 TaxID=3156454 RepID=UPI003399D8E6